MQKEYRFTAILRETPDDGGAYVVFPCDIRQEFGRGRLRVRAEFDGIPYEGSVVNMGVRDPEGKICYIIGVKKSIRRALGKSDGDPVGVRITVEETAGGGR